MEPLRTYRVSYRVVADTQPTASVVFTYTVDAVSHVSAEDIASTVLVDDVAHMYGVFDADWLKRVTVVRVK